MYMEKHRSLVFHTTSTKLGELCTELTSHTNEALYPRLVPFLDIEYDINASNIAIRELVDISLYLYLCDYKSIDGYQTIRHNVIVNLFTVIGQKYTIVTKQSILDVIDGKRELSTTLLASILVPFNDIETTTIQEVLSVLSIIMFLSPSLPSSSSYDTIFLQNKSKSFLFRSIGMITILDATNELRLDTLEIRKWLLTNLRLRDRPTECLPNNEWVLHFLNRIKYLGLNALLIFNARVSTIPALRDSILLQYTQITNNILR